MLRMYSVAVSSFDVSELQDKCQHIPNVPKCVDRSGAYPCWLFARVRGSAKMIAPESMRSAAAAHSSEAKLMYFVWSVNVEITCRWKLVFGLR